MINFKNDYSQIAHQSIIEALTKYQNESNNGYGLDQHSQHATTLIKTLLGNNDVEIHYMVGGTSANKTVLTHLLKGYEAVIACDTGHINVHETGTIEASGHKVLVVPNHDGKMIAQDIVKIVQQHSDEHMVKPRAIYISNATEIGTIYTKSELISLRKVCDELGLYLYLDGARLGVAMASSTNDLTWHDLTTLCDVFYIGGTKNGAMLGEAVVIVNELLKANFRYSIKQNGGMYSKGFVAGIQFECLFTDNRYLELASHANQMSQHLYREMKNLGMLFKASQVTNQIFPIIKKEDLPFMKANFLFEEWEQLDDEHMVIRFVTSWATTLEEVEDGITILKQYFKNKHS